MAVRVFRRAKTQQRGAVVAGRSGWLGMTDSRHARTRGASPAAARAAGASQPRRACLRRLPLALGPVSTHFVVY